MSHHSYEKMPDSLKKLNLDEAGMKQLNKMQWAVTEKVHGANFSFIYEAGKVSYAKRKELLDWQDDFFGFQLVAEHLDSNIRVLAEAVIKDFACKNVTVYGELFGGEYPHPEVDADDRVQAIQTGIYYAPFIEFCAFDIAIEREGGERSYIDYEAAINYFQVVDLFYAKPLAVCSFTDALNFNIDLQSSVPKALGLPELPNDNRVEGVVIKPMKECLIEVGKSKVRPIIKLKSDVFKEDVRFHEAQKWSFLPDGKSRSEELEFLVPELEQYITLNRVNNAISKIGQISAENEERLNEVKALVLEDVFESFDEDYDDMISGFSYEDRNWLSGRIRPLVNDVVLERLAVQ